MRGEKKGGYRLKKEQGEGNRVGRGAGEEEERDWRQEQINKSYILSFFENRLQVFFSSCTVCSALPLSKQAGRSVCV